VSASTDPATHGPTMVPGIGASPSGVKALRMRRQRAGGPLAMSVATVRLPDAGSKGADWSGLADWVTLAI
jgi:hypothetical protein